MEKAVAKVADFSTKSVVSVKIDGINLVVFRLDDGSFSALEDRCSHADVKLSKGCFEEGVIQCPAHGARFDVKTGQNLCMPAVTAVRSYPVKVQEGSILVEFPEL